MDQYESLSKNASSRTSVSLVQRFEALAVKDADKDKKASPKESPKDRDAKISEAGRGGIDRRLSVPEYSMQKPSMTISEIEAAISSLEADGSGQKDSERQATILKCQEAIQAHLRNALKPKGVRTDEDRLFHLNSRLQRLNEQFSHPTGLLRRVSEPAKPADFKVSRKLSGAASKVMDDYGQMLLVLDSALGYQPFAEALQHTQELGEIRAAVANVCQQVNDGNNPSPNRYIKERRIKRVIKILTEELGNFRRRPEFVETAEFTALEDQFVFFKADHTPPPSLPSSPIPSYSPFASPRSTPTATPSSTPPPSPRKTPSLSMASGPSASVPSASSPSASVHSVPPHLPSTPPPKTPPRLLSSSKSPPGSE